MRKQSASARRAARTAKAEAKRREREERRAQAIANHAEIQANKEAAKQAALDDLEQEGKNVAVLVEKIKQYEKSAEEKAGADLKKAQDFRDTLAKELARIEPKCKAAGMKFADFKKKYAPDFGRTKLYELLRIGRGDTTTEEARAHKTEKKREERAAKSSATSDVADTPRTATGDKLDTSVLGSKAAEQLAKHVAGSVAENARLAGEELPKDTITAHVEVTEGVSYTDTPAKKSKRALMTGKSTLDEILPDMTAEDKAALFHYHKMHAEMVGVKRAAA